METFADYILEEKNLDAKMEIAYYLAKKKGVFFAKSVILKTELTRLFLNYAKLGFDDNLVLTASLLCNCKKVNNAQNIEKIHSYAKEGADYLRSLGFSNKFCKICEEVNRYSNSNPREKESDVLELVDQFGGMLLDRPERSGFDPSEALVVLEHRNLKDEFNRYLYLFNDFIKFMQKIVINKIGMENAIEHLVKLYNESNGILSYIRKVCYEFEPEADKIIAKQLENIKKIMFEQEKKNRSLFTQETTQRAMEHYLKSNKEIDAIKTN